jgi:hypothetical protein
MRLLAILTASAAVLACAPAANAAAGAAWAAPWVIAPEDASCRTDLELTARSGAVTPVTLSSDGDRVTLRFAMETLAERAFLPIRIDQKAYANLVLRGDGPGQAVMTLSEETLAALRHGKTLQIAWLSGEAVHTTLGGAAQGVADLRTCGAQVAARYRAQQQSLAAERSRAEQEARAKAVTDEQLAAIRAQRAAAEAEGRRQAAEAQRLTAEAERASAQAEQDRAYAEQARRRALAQQYYTPRDAYPAPSQLDDESPPPWAYRRYYPR